MSEWGSQRCCCCRTRRTRRAETKKVAHTQADRLALGARPLRHGLAGVGRLSRQGRRLRPARRSRHGQQRFGDLSAGAERQQVPQQQANRSKPVFRRFIAEISGGSHDLARVRQNEVRWAWASADPIDREIFGNPPLAPDDYAPPTATERPEKRGIGVLAPRPVTHIALVMLYQRNLIVGLEALA